MNENRNHHFLKKEKCGSVILVKMSGPKLTARVIFSRDQLLYIKNSEAKHY